MNKTVLCIVVCAGTLLAWQHSSQAAEAFPNPAGGWTYLYTGDQLQTGEPAFDGTWTHDNGSDAFGGDEIGGVLDPVNNPDNNPGGANLLTEGNTQYLRIQDTGDPRDYDGATAAWDDPSNRKIYFGHYLSQDLQEADTLAILDNGVTLTFRARIPTAAKAGGPLDPLHRDGQNTAGDYPDNGVVPYPEGGDGYLTSDGAKGNFVIRQIGDGTAEHPGGAVALSLTVPTDTPGGNPNSGQAGFSGLTMNERNGSTPNGNVDFGEGSGENNFVLDPTDWHEFWIAIRKTRDPVKADATHDVFVWRDGTLIATSHKVTAGDGSDLNAGSFIATGGSATGQNFALDVDWYGYKQGFVLPEGGQVPPDVIVTPVGGTMFYQAGGGLEVDVEALMPGSTIPDGGFEVILNDVDITGQLTLTGSGADAFRTATYNGLTPNTQYSAVVRVTDSTGLVTEITSDFDTFVETGGLTIETEDYNYYGLGIDDPPPGTFYGIAGTPDVDFVDTTMDTTGDYRSDGVDMDSDTDVTREKFTGSGFADYQVTEIETGEWLNYTRTFPNKVFTPYLRAGAGADRQLRLDQVTSDASQMDQTTKPLGLFVATQTRTVYSYRYMPLTDAFGVARSVNLSGSSTIRLSATDVANDVNHNFLFFADAGAAESTLPWASAVSPAPDATEVPGDAEIMVSLMDGDNPVSTGSIAMLFDGADVTASLTVQDTAAGADVSYAPGGLADGTTHTVELTYGDTAGGSDSRTWSFTIEGEMPTGLIISVVETGGDNEPTDTIVAQWTGQTFVNGIAGEPIPGSGAEDPYTVGYFESAAPAFVDRNHRYLDDAGNNLPVPAYLVGGEYIMSGNDNRDNDAYVLDVTVSQDVDVYMLIDNRTNKADGSNTAPPNIGPGTGAMEWIDPAAGWEPVISAGNRRHDTRQADEVAIDEGADDTINQWYSVYRKQFAAGTFQLYQANNSGRNMYGVVVTTPQELLGPVSIVKNTDGTVTVTWSGGGVLEAAPAVTGPWAEVEGATSPATFTPSEAAVFGRIRK
ncbi:MAG: hypothetical protein H7A46_23335 [Verrucomicrobiales bacterium]|nr:hypothetical protein [Verrucomicrobiales bacterium]